MTPTSLTRAPLPIALLLLAFTASPTTRAQGPAAAAVPNSHIPAPVLLELRLLERQFDAALLSDCAPGRCYTKGCSYQRHLTVDLPRTSSLPGLGGPEGPGSVPPQEYLTEARCEFAHEKTVSTRDVKTLARRLEQRLSKAWLKVTVGHAPLDAVPASLRDDPEPAPREPPEEKPKDEEEAPPTPPEWDAKVALRELWLSLLPHFSWMIALLLGTLAALTLIWAARRLGRDSLEERALLAQLEAEAGEKGGGQDPAPGEPVPDERAEEEARIAEQERLWSARVAEAQLGKDDGLVKDVLEEWLREGEHELLARAVLLFGDRLLLTLPLDPELALRKAELASYLRDVDEAALPSREAFFRTLNQKAVSAALLAQSEVRVYRSLREEFGARGLRSLLAEVAPRHGALLFALVPQDIQRDLVPLLSLEQRAALAESLLASTRASKADMGYLLEVLTAAREGRPLPAAPADDGIEDRGRAVDGPAALSVLLSNLEPPLRAELLRRALARFGASAPAFYEDILYPDMLLQMPDELRREMLLEVETRALAGWMSVQKVAFQETLLALLPRSLQDAVRQSASFSSRAEQARLAARGQRELSAALKAQLSRGKLTLVGLFG